ncbi:MAG: hypothetical protein O4860_14420, partial [Trichodesmium sp. St2_bin2_1]|nr:hypothetical protein [Trichodesmium sp. St2_bin2_1]
MGLIDILTGRNNKGEFLADGEIYGVVSAKSSPPRGSGKTLTALDLILKQANILDYGIVFNFDIDCNVLYYYCYYKKYWNVIKQIIRGNIIVKSIIQSNGKTNLSRYIQGRKFIFVIDEAGIFCSSRNWGALPDNWQQNLAMMRQYNIRLWWIAQHYDHVDRLLRTQTNYIIECNSVLKPSKKLNGACIIDVRQYKIFTNDKYLSFSTRTSTKAGNIVKFLKNMMSLGQFNKKIDLSERLLFKVYKSFNSEIG